MSGFAVELVHLSKTFAAGQTGSGDVAAVRGIDLGIRAGEFFTLLGPSGCGKTTTLRLIAGFETPTDGEVLIEGKPMAHVPPHRRPVNMVFQNYALFPHLTVAQNVGFGPSVRHMPREERERRVQEALALVRLPDIGRRKPSQLSGGQQQRVALARALINEPAVLLLDEPLGALDLKLRKQMQTELKHLQQAVGITFVYVTHDQEEALTMSDRIAVMNEGLVLQVGTPVEIYEQPTSRFVADFIGETNFVQGRVAGREGELVSLVIEGDRLQARLPGDALALEQTVTVALRPEKLNVEPIARANGTGLRGTVREVVYLGTDTRFIVRLATGEDVVARVQNIGAQGLGEFRVGDQVNLVCAPDDVRVLTS
ncbi:MAG: ABC transporter ATP-binding protein [Anaerolineales bacterium]